LSVFEVYRLIIDVSSDSTQARISRHCIQSHPSKRRYNCQSVWRQHSGRQDFEFELPLVIELACCQVRSRQSPSVKLNIYSMVVSRLDDTKREDIVFIAFQLWVLGMSFVAILNESIPHIFASLLTHVLATGWSIFQIQHTANFRSSFNKTIVSGTCGVSLLPTYWNERAHAEFPTLALNCLSLLISAFLTWKLVKVRKSPNLTAEPFLTALCVAVRMANIQTRRCFFAHQPHLQTRPGALDHDPTQSVLHGCNGGTMA
jgi:hypothetical protein